jgi:hypothetical protein
MMSGNGIATSAALRVGPFHYVDLGAVVLKKVEIYRGEFGQRIPKVADDGHRFQKYFRQHHRRADI